MFSLSVNNHFVKINSTNILITLKPSAVYKKHIENVIEKKYCFATVLRTHWFARNTRDELKKVK